MREKQFIYITVDTLKYLQMGGRIGQVSAFLGTLLNIKPLIVFKDGELVPYSKIRGRQKTLLELAKLMDKDIKGKRDEYLITLLEGDAYEECMELKGHIEREYGYKLDHEPFPVGPTIGSHIGPTVIGVAYLVKYEYV